MDQMVLQWSIDQHEICLDSSPLSGEKYKGRNILNVVFINVFTQEQIRDTQVAVVRLGELVVHNQRDCSGQ